MARKFTSWVFTWNNYPEDHEKIFQKLVKGEVFRYFAWGEEIGEKGTPHLQGFFGTRNSRAHQGLKQYLPGIWFEGMKGRLKDSEAYCSKQSKLKTVGEMPVQGKRNDLNEIKEKILKEKKNPGDIIDSLENFQQIRFAECLMKYRKPYKGERIVKYYWGSTGTGKTKTADEELVDYDTISYSNGFIIGYNGNKNVLIDDFRGEMPYNLLLKLCDRYSVVINIKGGTMPWNAEKITITSDRNIDLLYKNVGDLGQLKRRITEFREFKGPDNSGKLSDIICGEEKREEVGGNM